VLEVVVCGSNSSTVLGKYHSCVNTLFSMRSTLLDKSRSTAYLFWQEYFEETARGSDYLNIIFQYLEVIRTRGACPPPFST
jgi:hypothetical protein